MINIIIPPIAPISSSTIGLNMLTLIRCGGNVNSVFIIIMLVILGICLIYLIWMLFFDILR